MKEIFCFEHTQKLLRLASIPKVYFLHIVLKWDVSSFMHKKVGLETYKHMYIYNILLYLSPWKYQYDDEKSVPSIAGNEIYVTSTSDIFSSQDSSKVAINIGYRVF